MSSSSSSTFILIISIVVIVCLATAAYADAWNKTMSDTNSEVFYVTEPINTYGKQKFE
jgi:hypothetical protein